MGATSVISAPIQRPSPSDHRVGSSSSFTRLHVGSLALRPALLLCENLRPRVTTTPLPHATKAYGQLLGRDFNPLDLLLLLRTVRSIITNNKWILQNGATLFVRLFSNATDVAGRCQWGKWRYRSVYKYSRPSLQAQRSNPAQRQLDFDAECLAMPS
jgi:hypothetical protein